ncbi:MAG: glycosidase [Thermoprotei archaeon]|nr:MAG: glycosidase [Thermoprotei archaeon]
MLEEALAYKQKEAFSKLRGLRKPTVKEIFQRLLYLGPEDFKVEFFKKSKPLASFNPAAFLDGDKLLIFPRLIFDYYKYVSSIGLTELGLKEILDGRISRPLKTRIIVWPQKLWEFLGSEDPRIFKQSENLFYILYTGKGYFWKESEYHRRDVLALASLDAEWRLIEKKYFSITDGKEVYVPRSNKDSAFIKVEEGKAVMLTRPEIKGLRICWRSIADLEEVCIQSDTLEPVFVFEEWEHKVGWSTNVVKVSSNEYMVGWHGVIVEDNSYRNGIALIDSEGELLAISDYLLTPRGLIEEYGDRVLVIFGDGLVKYKDMLFWIGGISDYGIGIFAANIDSIFENLKWLKG